MINGLQIHLALNHLPVTGLLLSTLVLIAGFALKNLSVRRTGLALLVFTALGTVPAYLSGEPAEELVEDRPGFTHEVIEEHEEAAKFNLIWNLVTGAVALGALASTRSKWNRHEGKLSKASLALAVFSFTVAARTAHLGGLIDHEVLREPQPATKSESPQAE